VVTVAWVRACRADELSEAAARAVTLDGRAICVALADGQPRAIDDRCPHRDIALSGGLVRDGVVTCPGHFRRFDLRTGQCVGRPWESVRGYECAVVDGWVQVDLGPAQPRLSIRELLLAHALAGAPAGAPAAPADAPADNSRPCS
jgi:nitrite reductase/ring-hydroxylating ferredoxin subunit